MSSKKNNLKIGIDIRNIGKQRTGSEVVVLELTKRILKIDQENEYILLTDTNDNYVINYVINSLQLKDKKNVKIVSIPTTNKFIWSFWNLPQWVRKNKLDIYHTEYILPFFMPKNTKLITHIHDVSFKAYRKFISWKDIFFLDIFIPWSIHKADKIIAVSEFTKNEIIKYYNVDFEKVEIIYNSTDLMKKTDEFNEEETRKKYNFPEKFIFYVGTLQPRKNIPILIEAYARIKNKIPKMKLVIAGDKKAHNFDKKIDEIIKKYNLTDQEIIFSGFIDREDKMVAYKLARTLVAPSFYEGFGIVPLEAMEANIPVLVSDIPPHREVCGDMAIYFNLENLDELEKKLYTICIDKDLRNRLINLEKSRVSFFSWEKSAKKLLEIYKSLK